MSLRPSLSTVGRRCGRLRKRDSAEQPAKGSIKRRPGRCRSELRQLCKQAGKAPALQVTPQKDRGSVRLLWTAPHLASQRRELRRRSWDVAHRPLGRRGDRLRVVKPSSARQPASAIRTRATSILESWFSVASSRTVASSLRMRSAIVSSLNPMVSKAFTPRPCGATARTSSTWRYLSGNLWFLGSVAISTPTTEQTVRGRSHR
jgi:hypothetical protein